MRILLFGVGVGMLILATIRLRPSRMMHATALPQVHPRNFTALGRRIGAIASGVAADQTLALRAADTAALPRRNLGALRAMYLGAPRG